MTRADRWHASNSVQGQRRDGNSVRRRRRQDLRTGEEAMAGTKSANGV